MTDSLRRFALAALLLGGSAALAALLVVASTPSHARAVVPPLDSLPWRAVEYATPPRPPLALLYVQSRCQHCSRAAITFDSIADATGLRVVIASSDEPLVAEAYRAKLGLRSRIASDTTRALLRALGIVSVPTLVLFRADGRRELVVGFRRNSDYERTLAGFP